MLVLSSCFTAAACGSKASVDSLRSALKSPNATIDQKSTAAAVQASSDGANSSAGVASAGVPTFGFAKAAGLSGIPVLPGDLDALISNATDDQSGANAAFAAQRKIYESFCAQKASASVTIKASDLTAASSALGGNCTGTGEFTYGYTCTNNNTTLEWTFSYNNLAISCTARAGDAEAKAFAYAINGSGSVLIGLNKAGDKYLIRGFYDLTGSVTEGDKKETIDYEGGGAVAYDLNTGAPVVAAVVVAVNGKYAVFAAVQKNQALSRSGLVGVTFLVRGGNGDFIGKCQEKEEAVQCAIWNKSTKALVGSDITPEPTFPTEEMVDVDLSALTE